MKLKPYVDTDLSYRQMRDLAGLQEQSLQAHIAGKPGAILAQVEPGAGTMRVVFLDAKTTLEIQAVLLKHGYLAKERANGNK